MVVFEPLFCDQSMNTFPGRSDLRHPGDHQVGHVLLDRLGDLPGEQRRVVGGHACRRAGCTGECPWTRWSPAPPPTRSSGCGPRGRPRRTRPARRRVPGRGRTPAGPGARAEAAVRRIGSGVDAEPPLRHVQFQRGDLAEPGQRGRRVDHRVRLRPVGVLDDPPGHPGRRALAAGPCGRTASVVTPSGQRLRVTGRPARCGIITCATSAK